MRTRLKRDQLDSAHGKLADELARVDASWTEPPPCFQLRGTWQTGPFTAGGPPIGRCLAAAQGLAAEVFTNFLPARREESVRPRRRENSASPAPGEAAPCPVFAPRTIAAPPAGRRRRAPPVVRPRVRWRPCARR